eukprot:1224849-Prymnesium_polylepis.1
MDARRDIAPQGAEADRDLYPVWSFTKSYSIVIGFCLVSSVLNILRSAADGFSNWQIAALHVAHRAVMLAIRARLHRMRDYALEACAQHLLVWALVVTLVPVLAAVSLQFRSVCDVVQP